eukprot:SM000024S07879  [mRNA]  locus=s24:905657:907686:- [translate_table: standard]
MAGRRSVESGPAEKRAHLLEPRGIAGTRGRHHRHLATARGQGRHLVEGATLLIHPHSSRREAEEAEANPGNNLYITGLSTRVTERDLEDHFAREAKVIEARLVVDPRTKESRGFGFVTVSTIDEAERCMKYLNRSILEGRVITVERPLYKSTNEVKVEAVAQSVKENPAAAATTMAMEAVEGGPHGILHTAEAVIGIALHAILHIVGAGVIVLIPDPDHHGVLDL